MSRYIVRAAIRSPEGFTPKHICISSGFETYDEADAVVNALVHHFTFLNVDIFDTEEGDIVFEWEYKNQPEWQVFALEKGLTDGD